MTFVAESSASVMFTDRTMLFESTEAPIVLKMGPPMGAPFPTLSIVTSTNCVERSCQFVMTVGEVHVVTSELDTIRYLLPSV